MNLRKLHTDSAVNELVSRLAGQNHEAWIVGGAVRDLMLGIQPKDYDLATSATPEQVRQVFGRQARIIGRRFRLVHVTLSGNMYEVSTFRRQPTMEERSTREGDDGVMIWNDNQWGTREQDATRRDFTVNAMFYTPQNGGELYDPHHGSADIAAKVVRVIGDPMVRLAEDPVRIIRALKLVAYFGFTLEPSVERAVIELAPRVGLSSNARLFEELLKILGKPYALKMFEACRHYGVLRYFWKNLDAIWDHPEGKLMRGLLRQRDERASAGIYAKSQTMGLATVALAPVAPRLRELSGAASPLWLPAPELSTCCQAAVRHFFEPYTMPRFLHARVRDTLLLLPAFLETSPDDFVVRHPQYRYARELFLMFATHQGWNLAEVEKWPAPPDRVWHEGDARRGAARPRFRGGRGRAPGSGRRREPPAHPPQSQENA